MCRTALGLRETVRGRVGSRPDPGWEHGFTSRRPAQTAALEHWSTEAYTSPSPGSACYSCTKDSGEHLLTLLGSNLA